MVIVLFLLPWWHLHLEYTNLLLWKIIKQTPIVSWTHISCSFCMSYLFDNEALFRFPRFNGRNFSLTFTIVWSVMAFCNRHKVNPYWPIRTNLLYVWFSQETDVQAQVQESTEKRQRNAPINSKVQHPPRATPRAFELLKIGLIKFPPLGAKKPFKCPPISTELSLLKDKSLLQSNTLHAFQREICHNDAFKLLLKTLLKELFTSKGEIPSCKSVKTRQTTKKTHGHITSEQEINPVQIPHPSNTTFKFPPPWARCTVKCPGYARGGMLKFRIDWCIMFDARPCTYFSQWPFSCERR